MSIRQIIIVFLGCVVVKTSFAQSPYFRHITDREGLPSMVVYDVYQSKDGYIWLGTEAGISRYDGLRFENFDVPQSQGKSFAGIQEDSQGAIYFVNFVGQLFKMQGDKISEIEFPKGIKKSQIKSYFIDTQDNIWLCSNKVYLKTKGSTDWKILDLAGARFKSIHQDKNGALWVLAFDFIYQIDQKGAVLQSISAPETLFTILPLGESIKAVSSLSNKIYNYNISSQSWTSILVDIQQESPDHLNQIQQDDKGDFWIPTYSGVIHYQKKSNQFHTFIKGKYISDFLQDKEGNYWFTSLGEGVFILSSLEGLHFNSSNSALEFEQINCLAEDHLGNLYIGTNGNRLFYFDTKAQSISPSYSLPTGDVECMLVDKKRRKLYVENRALQVFDIQSDEQLISLQLGATPKDLAIYQDKYLLSVAGNVTHIHALNRVSKSSDFWAKETAQGDNVVASKRGRAVCVDDAKGEFWIALADGLYCYNAQGEVYELKSKKNKPIIAVSLQIDTEGLLWVGTIQDGIFMVKNKKIVKHLNKENGLISNFCRVIRDKTFLYICTDKGLQVYHIKTGQSRVFNQEDGLPSNGIKDLIIQKNKIYLATNKGLSVLNKDFSTTNHSPPLIYLTGLDIWDEAQALKEKHELAYHQNNLTIRFTGLAYRSGGNFQYKYRMKGLDEDWTYVASSNNFARYSALPSGKYQFEVKVINEDGIESKEAASIYIDVAYPIWEKWWFIALMVLLIIVVIALIFINYVRFIERKNQMEKALGKATLESLKLQMNPHFLFNAMSAIQRYMIRNDALKASNYLAQFSKLMRAVLENSRSEYISLEQEIDMLEDYLTLQQITHTANFQYQIQVSEELDPEEIAIPPMFAQPFIENAIEHGITEMEQEGMIQVSFSLEKDFILLKITDNGVGVEQATQRKQNNPHSHQSLATKITQERIALYKKSLRKNIIFEIQDTKQGTQVVFHLPYQNL